MVTTAPPFPATGNPHLDIELRELYARILGAEQLLGIAPGPGGGGPTDFGLVQVVEGTPVKLFQGFVDFDRGWFREGFNFLPGGGSAVVLGNPKPPFVVLQVFATVDVVFNNEVSAERFGVGTSADPPAEAPWVDTKIFYAYDTMGPKLFSYRGAELTLSFEQTRPGPEPDKFRSLGVVHTQARPIVAGFIHEVNQGVTEWPPGMEGRVHVMVVYADTPSPESVPLNQLRDKTLLSVTGPRSPIG